MYKLSRIMPLLLIGFFCFPLLACSSKKPSPLPTTTKALHLTTTPTLTEIKPSQANATFTPFPSPTKKSKNTPIRLLPTTKSPSQTARPTKTATLGLSISPTLSVEELATQQAEEARIKSSIATVEAEMILFPDCSSPQDHFYSPDGEWVAIWCVNNMTGVYNRSDPSINWPLKYNEIYPTKDQRENQYHYIIPFRWTVDRRYLYLRIKPCCMDGGCPAYYSGEALVRLDLLTGEVTQTLQPAAEGFRLYNFKISHVDTYLAYFRTWIEHPILNLANLVTGEEQHFPLGDKYSEAGDVIWSPDMSRIIFSARTGDECEKMTNYLVMMDLDDADQTLLLESTTNGYTPVEWKEDNRVIINIGYDEGYITLDLANGETSPYLTPTPTPIK